MQEKLIKDLSDSAAGSRKTLKMERPALTAADAGTLHSELKSFRMYMNDNIYSETVHWSKGARVIAIGRAKICLESFIVQAFPTQGNYQKAVESKDATLWTHHRQCFVVR